MKPPAAGEPAAQAEGAVAFRLFADRPRPTLTVSEQMAAQVGDRILDGRLAPGARIDERALAADFGVSRGTVREAIRILEREGLACVQPHHGAMVSTLSADDLREIYQVRAALFDAVVRHVAQTRPPALLEIHRSGLARLQALADLPDDGGAYAETVYRLLMLTAEHAGNRRLQRMLAALSLQTLRYSKLALKSRDRRQQSFAWWRAGLQAFERGDAQAMMALARQRFEASAAEAARQLAVGAAHP